MIFRNVLRKKDKKGISIMIGYIILVSLAIGMSVVAYNWLLNLVPNETVACPEGVSLSIRNVVCDAPTQRLNFTVKNNGAFTVDRFDVFVNDEDGSIGVYEINSTQTMVSFTELHPEDTFEVRNTYTNFVDGSDVITFQSNLKLVEIRPYKLMEGDFKSCKTVQTKLQCV